MEKQASKNEELIFQPIYIKYIYRSLLYIKTRVLILSIVPFILLFVKGLLFFKYGVFFIIIFTLISLLHSLFLNKYYLDTLIININHNNIKLIIKKKDNVFLTHNYNINDINIDVIKVWYSRYPKYYLHIQIKNKESLRQHAVGNWNKEIFVKILEAFNKLKEKHTFTNFIK